MGVRNKVSVIASVMAAVFSVAAIAVGAPPRVPEPAAPDLLFFSRKVAADLHTRCAGCHSDPESAGRYLLKPLDNLVRPGRKLLLANYRATLRFLDPARPERSVLLRKSAGAGHGGGALLDQGSRDFVTMLQFAQGATLRNLPPEAILSKRIDGRPAAAVKIDGTLSGDPDGDALHYAWSVADSPAGGRLRLDDKGDGTVVATATRPGRYRIELRVHDGKLASLPAIMLLVIRTDGGAPAMGGGMNGMGGNESDPMGEAVKPAPRPDLTKRTDPPTEPGTTPRPGPTKTGRTVTSNQFLSARLDPLRLRLIRRMYYDLKWRGPTVAELEQWYSRPHEEMVDAFLADEEMWDAWYERQLYYFLLLDRFRPKAHRLTTLPQRLKDKKVDVPLALQEIVRSQFFNARNPGNDTYCTVVLEQCLGLVVQERSNKRILDASKKMYDGYRVKLFKDKGDSQADFVRIVFRQRRFFTHLLARTWKSLHGTKIEKKELARAAEQAASGSHGYRKVLRGWLVAGPYVDRVAEARTKQEIPYVRSLFLDTLGRLPSYDELRNVRNAFLSLADPTPIRLVMGRVLLQSNGGRMPTAGNMLAADPRKFVRTSFLRLFARQPTPKELTAFVDGLKADPRITPRVVLWTLLSSAEYQTY